MLALLDFRPEERRKKEKGFFQAPGTLLNEEKVSWPDPVVRSVMEGNGISVLYLMSVIELLVLLLELSSCS